MLNKKKIIVVMPAYNAESTLEDTYKEIPFDIIDEVIIVDDASSDKTLDIAKKLGINHIIRHEQNKGYGANQKTCYDKALSIGADIVIMLHPDYQYTPKLLASMAYMIANDLYPVVLASRILGKGALKGGMPLYKFLFNRFLTFIENVLINAKISEYHTGYRGFSKKVLEKINYHYNSDNFVFDNQMLSQIVYAGFAIGELSCPTKYFPEASSINFRNSTVYGLGVLKTSFSHFLQRLHLAKFRIYEMNN